MDNSIVTLIGNTRVQTPSSGYLLTDGEIYSLQVYLGEGVEPWQAVIDEGQLDEIVDEEI